MLLNRTGRLGQINGALRLVETDRNVIIVRVFAAESSRVDDEDVDEDKEDDEQDDDSR